MIEDAAGLAERALGIGQRRFLDASVALDDVLGCVFVEFLGILQILLGAVFLIELSGNECCRRLRAGIRAVFS